MPSQRIILGIGLAILLVIGAASIGLDLKSRSDTASVDRALGILSKLSDMRPLLRQAESAARAFAISGNQEFATEYREASDAIVLALAALIDAVKDNPTEQQCFSIERLTGQETAVEEINEHAECRNVRDNCAPSA